MNAMNLKKALAEELGCSKAEIDRMANGLRNVLIRAAVVREDGAPAKLQFPPLFHMRFAFVGKRVRRDPQSGKHIDKEATYRVSMKPTKQLKEGAIQSLLKSSPQLSQACGGSRDSQ